MVQFEGVLPEAAPCVAYAPVDLDGQVGILVDVSPEVLLCVVVCFLPIHSGHQVRWTYQPGSHRRKVTQDF